MVREVVKIDESLCNGCGVCVPECHEGALQIIDGKARLVSDLMCDGLGACLGHCPEGAITIEKREAEAYNETKVMEIMVDKGQNTVIAHMKHLKDHNETQFLKEAVRFLRDNAANVSFDVDEVIQTVHNQGKHQDSQHNHGGGGCPGSQARTIVPQGIVVDTESHTSIKSELRQWPVQMHLINPAASYYKNSDVLIAADCVAFAMGNFHQKFLKGKTLAIACPKLDQGQEIYIEKLTRLINDANINTLTVMIMQVPCCGGLLQMVKIAVSQASRKVPVKMMVVSIEGEVLKEEWV
ncbi:MAG: 4Fe-4S binding protein [Bacteroidales bacterium]|nr:4Fe-4S binding protein [Bacteroidales bacterium]MBN2821132.1 4Fe-4S binding protein [Bacteroidales bacterium]